MQGVPKLSMQYQIGLMQFFHNQVSLPFLHIEAFKQKCYRILLHISYRDHKTNDYVRQQITTQAGNQEPLLATIRRRKLCCFGHTCRHQSLSKTICQGTVEGGRSRGRPKKSWGDNIKDWTGISHADLIRRAEDREAWQRVAVNASAVTPRR